MRGTILIRDLEFQARHGAHADERRTLRRFQIDLELQTNLARSVASDRLGDTVDYGAVCALVLEVSTSRAFHLLEALAGAIVDAIVSRWPEVDVSVELRKLHPPCPGNPAFTAVRLSSRDR